MFVYKDHQYAHGRLLETIIRYTGFDDGKSKAARVVAVDLDKQGLILQSVIINTGKVIMDRIEKFDLNPVPLGFVNGKYGCGYWVRTPVRKWKQGLWKANARSLYGDGHWDERGIARTVENDFFNVRHAIAKSLDMRMAAFHRDFAVDYEKNIYYKMYGKIGQFTDPAKNEYVLDKGCVWVEESLKGAL